MNKLILSFRIFTVVTHKMDMPKGRCVKLNPMTTLARVIHTRVLVKNRSFQSSMSIRTLKFLNWPM